MDTAVDKPLAELDEAVVEVRMLEFVIGVAPYCRSPLPMFSELLLNISSYSSHSVNKD